MRLFLVLAFGLVGSIWSDLRTQASLTNNDVLKLVKSGLSEEFVLNLIEQQGSRLSCVLLRTVHRLEKKWWSR
jgi:hypothetical protein